MLLRLEYALHWITHSDMAHQNGASKNIPRVTSGPNFMALLTAEILRLRSQFPTYVQAQNFCTSLVSVTGNTHAQKPKFTANLWNTLATSTEFPASVSADSVLTVSRAMHDIGPRWLGSNYCWNCSHPYIIPCPSVICMLESWRKNSPC